MKKETTRTKKYCSLRNDDEIDIVEIENFLCPQCKEFQLNIFVNKYLIHWGTWCINSWPWICSNCFDKHMIEEMGTMTV